MYRAVVLLSLVAATPALAEDRPLIQQTQAPGRNPMDCYCRAQGRMFALGEKVCLRTAQGDRMAECQMVINVTSWGIKDEPCPES